MPGHRREGGSRPKRFGRLFHVENQKKSIFINEINENHTVWIPYFAVWTPRPHRMNTKAFGSSLVAWLLSLNRMNDNTIKLAIVSE